MESQLVDLPYPKTENNKSVPHYTFVASLIKEKNKILIQKRESKMLNGLWEIPNIRINNLSYMIDELNNYISEHYGFDIEVRQQLGTINHSYSHFKMELILLECKKFGGIKTQKQIYNWIKKSDIDNYAFHKVNHKIFGLLENDL